MSSLTSLSLLKDAFTTMRGLCPSDPEGYLKQDLKQNRSQVSETVAQWLTDDGVNLMGSVVASPVISWRPLDFSWVELLFCVSSTAYLTG